MFCVFMHASSFFEVRVDGWISYRHCIPLQLTAVAARRVERFDNAKPSLLCSPADQRYDSSGPSIDPHTTTMTQAAVLAETDVEATIQGMPDPYSFNTKR